MRQGSKASCATPQRGELSDSLWRLEAGSASVVGLGIIAGAVSMFLAIGTAVSMSVGLVKLQLTADATALVAADTLVGAIAGYPCENAEALTIRNGATLTTCRIVGLVVEVSTTTSLGPFQVSRWAKAG